jgi:hypothetical protein
MINNALVFLKGQLNAYLQVGADLETPTDDRVVFLEDNNQATVSFQSNRVTALLINVEEETALGRPDRYSAVSGDGQREQVVPEIRLNLYVLFVARFVKYEDGLGYLSQIIRYFQRHRQFESSVFPDLGEGLNRLVVELVTLPFNEQNEVWSALRTTYLPSVLYRVKMIVFRDLEARGTADVAEREIEIRQ